MDEGRLMLTSRLDFCSIGTGFWEDRCHVSWDLMRAGAFRRLYSATFSNFRDLAFVCAAPGPQVVIIPRVCCAISISISSVSDDRYFFFTWVTLFLIILSVKYLTRC